MVDKSNGRMRDNMNGLWIPFSLCNRPSNLKMRHSPPQMILSPKGLNKSGCEAVLIK